MRLKSLLVLSGSVVCCLNTPLFAGPYQFSLPVVGVTQEDLPALKKNFSPKFGRVHVEGGVIEFVAGGGGPASLLKLSDMRAALQAAHLQVNPALWILKEQELGIFLTAEEMPAPPAIKTIVESFVGGEVQVLGTVLIEGSNCQVLHLGTPIDYLAFERHVQQEELMIEDLIWGHWAAGWGIEGAGPHSEEGAGALPKPLNDRAAPTVKAPVNWGQLKQESR